MKPERARKLERCFYFCSGMLWTLCIILLIPVSMLGLCWAVFYYDALDNTVYASGFSAEGFRQVSEGMTPAEVRALIGEPIGRNPSEPGDMWVRFGNGGRAVLETGGGLYHAQDLDNQFVADFQDGRLDWDAFAQAQGGEIGRTPAQLETWAYTTIREKGNCAQLIRLVEVDVATDHILKTHSSWESD